MKKEYSLIYALLPLLLLIGLLGINIIYISGSDALGGSNQFILILSAFFAYGLAYIKGTTWEESLEGITRNITTTAPALFILLLIGSLAAIWTFSGIVPAMIYYGLKLIHPQVFLPLSALICAVVSIAIGSSWSTTATVGIALMGMGNALGLNSAWVAGAIVSGAYFGDKISPLSDTTNLAAAVAGVPLFTHIKYLFYTTLPSFSLALLLFALMGSRLGNTVDLEQINTLAEQLKNHFHISPWLFIVPIVVLILIIKKTPAIPALFIGIIGGIAVSLVAQWSLLNNNGWLGATSVLLEVLTTHHAMNTGNEALNELLSTGGMAGMLPTIWLILAAMIFGGVMEAAGFLKKISDALLNKAKSEFSLFAATGASCMVTNITASDQYLAVVIPGKMFKKSFEERKLAPENLSRTLEDTGTVTSVLIPWNTCGAYQSSILNVPTLAFLPFAFFNLFSPLSTLIVAYIKWKIRRINS